VSAPARAPVWFLAFLIIVIPLAAGFGQTTGQGRDSERVGCYGIVRRAPLGAATQREPDTLSQSEQKRKAVAERLDRHGLLYSSRVVTDSDPGMLIPPEGLTLSPREGFTIASTPPTVEFAIVPVKPKFFAGRGIWANWAQSNYDSGSGKFYGAVGDDGTYGAHIYLVEYDTHAKKIRCLPEINRILGREEHQFSDGKIHGWLDFYKSNNLPRPHIWFCTYWTEYPEPRREDFATGYRGGHIVSCDPSTDEFVDYGVPVVRASWPYHRIDLQRGILYAVGMFGEFLSWDINQQRTRWAGYLPEGMRWWVRAILIDRESGMVYTSNDAPADTLKHLIRYDPEQNRFFKLKAHVPPNAITGTYDHMRAQTRDRGPDGLYYAVTYSGEMFTFNPQTEEVADKGLNWTGEERYTASMDRSPGGRYVYYLPGAHGLGYADGSPIVQYDTRTGRKKVIAFLFPYYFRKYGYIPGGSFSIKLDNKGEKLFIVWNGAFAEPDARNKLQAFGHCSVMVVTIPESERVE
jgi:hypothetical protein